MHKTSGADHLAAKDMTDALVPQTDAENRHLLTESANDIVTDAGLIRGARSGRNNDALGSQLSDFVERDLVVPFHERVRPQLAKILDEIVGKAVVVIEDEEHEN
jgi:hypothetical protein